MVKKAKKSRDPSAPKPPLNSYLEFYKEERPRVLIQYPDFSTKEVAREIGKRWKGLEKDVKDIYEQRTLENKSRYRNQMEEYRAKLTTSVHEKENDESVLQNVMSDDSVFSPEELSVSGNGPREDSVFSRKNLQSQETPHPKTNY